jgi:PAS domain S-box-containing protein
METLRKFGIDQVGVVPWGTHLCQLYETKKDLIEILVPYFKTGLRSNEYCLWVTSSSQEVTEANAVLRKAISRFNYYVKKGKMSIINYNDTFQPPFETQAIISEILTQEKTAIEHCFSGLRFAATGLALPPELWAGAIEFETVLNKTLPSHRILGLCGFSIPECSSANIVKIQCNHLGTLVKTANSWALMEDAMQRRETQAHYQNVIRASIDAFWIVDTNCRFLEVNGAFCNLTGYSHDELLNMTITDLEMVNNYEQIQKQIEEIRQLGHGRLETYFRRKDGLPIALELNANHMMTIEGERIFVFAHNITKRKRNETAVKQSETKYRELANCITDSFVALDSNLRYVYWNRACEKITGIKAKDALGHHVLEIFSGTQTQKVADTYLKVLKTRKPKVYVNELVMNNRNVIVENHIYPTKTGVAVFTKDITPRRELQRKLFEYTQKLEDLVRVRTEKLKTAERLAAIGETAGMVGHDIRNPLQTISGELYLIKTDVESLPDSQTRRNLMLSLTVIGDQLTYINKIVADLQDFARTSTPVLEQVDLEKTVNEIMDTVNVPQDIRVQVSVKEQFPLLKSDVTYLKRVLINLITNAIQAMPNGGKLTLTADFNQTNAILKVQDTGQGIGPEAKAKIFKPLFTTKAKGQGLGLAVVKKLTETLGGSIRFESEVGQGTSFIVELPLAEIA